MPSPGGTTPSPEGEMPSPGGEMPARLWVELSDLAGAAAHRAAWIGLAERALEPNVFLDPDFALAAAEAFSPRRRPAFALVWAERAGGTRDLVGLAPLRPPTAGTGFAAAAWFHDLAPLGGLLLDAAEAEAALEALLGFLARRWPSSPGLLLRSNAADGPAFARLVGFAEASGRALLPIAAWRRAVLRSGAGEGPRPGLSKGRQKELARQRRRLAERGPLHYVEAGGVPAVAAAFEQFLALEARGWKGARGTAMLRRPAEARFARRMTQALAARRQCRIAALQLGEVPIAMGVLLSSGSHEFFWKTAYDETLGALSPGVQFVASLTEAQLARAAMGLTDSCAIPDHPMVDRLWSARRSLADLMLALRPGPPRLSLRAAVASLKAAQALKARIKALLRRGAVH